MDLKATLKAFGVHHVYHAGIRTYARLRPRCVATRRGVRYDLDLTQEIERATYFGGWEPETIAFLERTVQPGWYMIEVGANVGVHSLLLAKLVGAHGKVIAFEPTHYAQEKLRANLALNPALTSRVSLRSELVTNHELATPNLRIRSRWAADGQNVPAENVSAPAIALDSLTLPRLDFVKIDVDGYERKVLEGAVELLTRFRPVLLVELCEYSLNEQGDSIRDIFALLTELGYTAYRENGSALSLEATMSEVGGDTSINGIFR